MTSIALIILINILFQLTHAPNDAPICFSALNAKMFLTNL